MRGVCGGGVGDMVVQQESGGIGFIVYVQESGLNSGSVTKGGSKICMSPIHSTN